MSDRLRRLLLGCFRGFRDANFPDVTRVVGEALASGRWIQRGFVRTLAWITPVAGAQA